MHLVENAAYRDKNALFTALRLMEEFVEHFLKDVGLLEVSVLFLYLRFFFGIKPTLCSLLSLCSEFVIVNPSGSCTT